MDKNELYYGDNLQIMRDLASDSVDLIYLDPPFNSKATYNVLYKSPKGIDSEAQVAAFEDTWKWSEAAELAYEEILSFGDTGTSEMIRSFRQFMGESDMMAYLSFMGIRLLELKRLLKDTGSIFLHCDPTASHYLKIIMDSIFRYYRSEIVWKRTSAHSDSKTVGNTHDIILYYTKSSNYTWNQEYQAYDENYIKTHYNKKTKEGRIFRTDNLTATSLSGGGYTFEWNGVTKLWRCPVETMRKYEKEGRIRYTKNGTAEYIRYLDEMPGKPLQDLWDDISPINSQAAERLGYNTQKPQALLERIINASSNPGDRVLDPFCGCGTTVAAAQKLERSWIGIDVTHIAINLMELRITSAFPKAEFEVKGIPKDIAGAHDLAERDRFEFQYWACSLVNAHPSDNKRKGADHGIDGIIYFKPDGKTDAPVIVSVKSGKNINVSMIRDLLGAMEGRNAPMGLFITLFPPTAPMKKLAISSGFIESPIGKHPRLQILTIEDLLSENQRPDIPYINMQSTFRRAPLIRKTKVQEQLFDSDE